MIPKQNNFAFIDGQNLYLGVIQLGWRLDYKKFFVYLKYKYGIKKAYLFIGYLSQNKNLYQKLEEIGYTLVFKPITIDGNGKPKGNIDANLVLRCILDIDLYDGAVVVTSDGDFYCLIDHLYSSHKLIKVLSPCKKRSSHLLLKSAKEKVDFLDKLENKLSYIK